MSHEVVLFKENNISNYVRLVEEDITLLDRDDVKKRLPDILGRALARSWIDPDYKKCFLPKHLLLFLKNYTSL